MDRRGIGVAHSGFPVLPGTMPCGESFSVHDEAPVYCDGAATGRDADWPVRSGGFPPPRSSLVIGSARTDVAVLSFLSPGE